MGMWGGAVARGMVLSSSRCRREGRRRANFFQPSSRLSFYWDLGERTGEISTTEASTSHEVRSTSKILRESLRASGLYKLKLSQSCVHLCFCTQCWLVPWTTINPKFYLNQSACSCQNLVVYLHNTFIILSKSVRACSCQNSCLPSHDIYHCDTGDCRLLNIYRHIWLLTWCIYACKYETYNTLHVRETQFQGRTINSIPFHSNRNESRYSYIIHCITYKLHMLQTHGPYRQWQAQPMPTKQTEQNEQVLLSLTPRTKTVICKTY